MFSTVVRHLRPLLLRRYKRKGILLLSDTTLRDGEQMPGVRLRPEAKVRIARTLAEAGFHSLDVGFPAAAPEEKEAIRRVVAEVRGPVITALCRTRSSDIDDAAEALAAGRFNKKGITLFIGTSPQHRLHKHRMSKTEILKAIVDSVIYARRYFQVISVGPEDGSRTEPDYLHEIYYESIAAGATTIGFADTLGILTPEKAADRIKGVQDGVPNLTHALLGVHFHNDLGLGTANALACVAQGVNIVQGTINGIGERAGNTALEEVVMALHLHRDQYAVDCGVDPRSLAGLSRLVADETGFHPPPNKAVVGSNIFATESGIHQDGLLKHWSTYCPFGPEQIGAGPVRLVLGKHSGAHAVQHRFEQLGIHLESADVDQVLHHLKRDDGNGCYDSDEDVRRLRQEVFGASLVETQNGHVAASI